MALPDWFYKRRWAEASSASFANPVLQTSIDRFADRVVELLVIEVTLPDLRSILAKEGDLNEAEALMYLVSPFHVMSGLGHFTSAAIPLGSALTASAAKLGCSLTVETVMRRQGEYAVPLLDAEALNKRALFISEQGLFQLARRACRHILDREIQDAALLYEVGSVWQAAFTSWRGGAGLKELFDGYLQLRSGDDEWVSSVRRGIHGGREAAT